MKKLLLVIALLPAIGYAEGPLFHHTQTISQQEFDNVYQDLRSKMNSSISSITATGTLSAGNQFLGPFGSAGSPTFSFTSDPTSGIFSSGAGTLSLGTSGGIRLNLSTTELRSVINIVSAGSANNLGSATDKWVTIYVGSVQGTTTNDNAPIGTYGQWSSTNQGTPTAFAATTQFGNVVSTTVLAGDYDFTGCIEADINGATITQIGVATSLFSGNTTTDHVIGDNQLEQSPPTTNNNSSVCISNWRVSTTGTTVYLKAAATYSAGTPRYRGRLSLRRTR